MPYTISSTNLPWYGPMKNNGNGSDDCDLLTTARRLGMGPKGVKEVRVAGLLHDIGMAQIQESIVNKPGPLTPEDYEQIKDHVEIGAEILQPLTYRGRSVDYDPGQWTAGGASSRSSSRT